MCHVTEMYVYTSEICVELSVLCVNFIPLVAIHILFHQFSSLNSFSSFFLFFFCCNHNIIYAVFICVCGICAKIRDQEAGKLSLNCQTVQEAVK